MKNTLIYQIPEPMRRVKVIGSLTLLLACCVMLSAHSLRAQQMMADGGVIVKVDGEVVEEKAQYVFNRDETYQLDVEGLKPKSFVYVRYMKAGIKMDEVRAMADDTGKLTRLLEAPEKSIGVTCEVAFTSVDGNTQEVRFRIKFRNLDKKG